MGAGVTRAPGTRDRSPVPPTWIRQGEVVKKQRRNLGKVDREVAAMIAENADAWLERMKHSDDPKDRVEFLAWLQQSPLHVREILCATTWDKLLDHTVDPEHKVDIDTLLRQTGSNVVPLDTGVVHEIASATDFVERRPLRDWLGSRRGLSALATAACLTVALAIGWQRFDRDVEVTQQYGTTIGEQRSVGLSDGSIVHMNTQSRVRIDFSEEARDVHLLAGQAIFKVKHDAVRPFRVHVGSTVVQAIGTQFDVHRLKDRTNVAVIEGVVQIISGADGKLDAATLAKLPEHTKVPAGESVVIVADGELSPHSTISPQDASAWQQRRLIFHKHTLAEIAAEFNRYNRAPQIRVEGDALRARQFSVVFDANDPQSLLDYLSMDKQIAFVRTGDELVIRMSGYAQNKPPK